MVLFCLMAVTAVANPTLGSQLSKTTSLCNVGDIIPSHYALGISVPWGGEEINRSAVKRAFRQEALKYHTDKQYDDEKKKLYEQRFMAYGKARDCLLGHKTMPKWEDREIRAESIQAWVGVQKANLWFWWEEIKIDVSRLFNAVSTQLSSFSGMIL